jgi:hypothetical protein
MSEHTPDRDEVIILAKHAGLGLPPAYLDELVDAYANVRRIVARIPWARPRSDEPAHVFDPMKFMPRQG